MRNAIKLDYAFIQLYIYIYIYAYIYMNDVGSGAVEQRWRRHPGQL